MADRRTLIERVRVRRGRLELAGAHADRLAASAALIGAAIDAAAIERALSVELAARPVWGGVIAARLSSGGFTVASEPEPARDGEALAAGLALGVRIGAAPVEVEGGRRPKWERAAPRPASTGPAVDAGCDEWLLATDERVVFGAEGANAFFVIDGALVTPSVESGAFPGILRAAVILAAGGLGIDVDERRVELDEVARASDAFLASSVEGLVSVRAIDGLELPAPPPRSLWRRQVPQLRLRVHELGRASRLPARG